MKSSEYKVPLLSIITPVYNREDCIAQCLDSVGRQVQDAAVEHIVVDDGSSDSTWDIVRKFGEQNPHIRTLRLEKNCGTNAARNFAVKHANGRFVMLLDSDDALADNAVKTILRQIEQQPDIKHFVFAVDDRVDYYNDCGYVAGDCAAFTFRDFLEEKVKGDFAHVLLRDTMLKYPFEEKLRVFEGVFFLSFYKEAGKILFNNTIVINRDRSRSDRVTYILIPDSKSSLRRHLGAMHIIFTNFGPDFRETATGRNILINKLHKNYKFATLLGDNKAVKYGASQLGELGVRPSKSFKIINIMHCGPLIFLCAKIVLKLKYIIKKIE